MDNPLLQESPRRDTDALPNPAPPPSPPSPLPPSLHPAPAKQREEKKTALSKVVIRRLPPCLTKEQLEEQLHPLPAHDYFEFCTADPRSCAMCIVASNPENSVITKTCEEEKKCRVTQ